MTTSQFIELLKKADPSGTAHIKLSDGIPLFVDSVEGIMDAPYSYLDEEGNYVFSTQGNKVEISTMDVWAFVEKNYHTGITWEEIKSKFKFDLTYKNKELINDRTNALLTYAKSAFDSVEQMHQYANSLDSQTLEDIGSIMKKKKLGLVSNKQNKR